MATVALVHQGGICNVDIIFLLIFVVEISPAVDCLLMFTSSNKVKYNTRLADSM